MPAWAQHGLSEAQYAFALVYLENGFNARAAYQKLHPEARLSTAGTEGHRTLNNPKVRAFLNEQLEVAWKPLQVGADQALARIGHAASLDVRDLFDEQGRLLKPHEWPDAVRSAVKSVQDGPLGTKVTLVDPLGALRTILEIAGKVKGPTDSFDALAAALRADIEERRKDDPHAGHR